MPAKSVAQQQAAGAALAAKEKGSASDLKGASKEMAKMSKKELEKIASTKHKGLPKKKKKLKEGVEEGDDMPMQEADMPTIANNLTFWVVEKPQTEQDDPMTLFHESNPFAFARQVMGGLREDQVHGFYLDEDEAANAAHDLVTAALEEAEALEEKKMEVTSKLEEVIKKMQKEINGCLEEGSDESMMKAEALMQKIKELRDKHKIVEASKKKVDPEELNEGLFDRLTAKAKGFGANVSARTKNLASIITKAEKTDPQMAKGLAMLRQKTKTLDSEITDVLNDLSRLFPTGTLDRAPEQLQQLIADYVEVLRQARVANDGFLAQKSMQGGEDSQDSNEPESEEQPQQSTEMPSKLPFGGQQYAVTDGKVRITVDGQRKRLTPIEFNGKWFIPLVKTQTGETKEVEKKGDKIFIKGTSTEVVAKKQ